MKLMKCVECAKVDSTRAYKIGSILFIYQNLMHKIVTLLIDPTQIPHMDCLDL